MCKVINEVLKWTEILIQIVILSNEGEEIIEIGYIILDSFPGYLLLSIQRKKK